MLGFESRSVNNTIRLHPPSQPATLFKPLACFLLQGASKAIRYLEKQRARIRVEQQVLPAHYPAVALDEKYAQQLKAAHAKWYEIQEI